MDVQAGLPLCCSHTTISRFLATRLIIEPRHEILVCVTSKAPQSLCWPLGYSMNVKLLTEHHLEYLSLKGACTSLSESTVVKMPLCWKSRVMARMCCLVFFFCKYHNKVSSDQFFTYYNVVDDFVCFDSFYHSQQFFSLVWTDLPGLNLGTKQQIKCHAVTPLAVRLQLATSINFVVDDKTRIISLCKQLAVMLTGSVSSNTHQEWIQRGRGPGVSTPVENHMRYRNKHKDLLWKNLDPFHPSPPPPLRKFSFPWNKQLDLLCKIS